MGWKVCQASTETETAETTTRAGNSFARAKHGPQRWLSAVAPPDVNKNGGAERQPVFGVIYSSGRLTGCETGPLSARDTFWQGKQATEAGLRNVQDRSRAFHKPQKKERETSSLTHASLNTNK